jgi:2-hydroxy-3-oxopropionate reductase
MGSPMVDNLLATGYRVHAYDPDPERLSACVRSGAAGSHAAEETVDHAAVVLTSLPSSESFVRLAEETLLPHARSGQLFLDMGTVIPSETRRLAERFTERGAKLVDAPCSGGPSGVRSRTLRMFVGGDPDAVAAARLVLEALGGPSHITHCGPSGAGQVVKGVNQLAMGLGAAAYLEAVAFGVRCGVDPSLIEAAIGGEENWREHVGFIATQAAAGKAAEVGVKFRELPYYLREAETEGFALPLTRALHQFCETGERVVIDDHRPAPSFWHELLSQAAGR